jgi:hypothetical protein
MVFFLPAEYQSQAMRKIRKRLLHILCYILSKPILTNWREKNIDNLRLST